MLSRLLHLQEGELHRLWPFFFLYSLIFSGLTLADGLSMALFVQDVGAKYLPTAYALIAVLNFVVVFWYFLQANTAHSVAVFNVIMVSSLGLFLFAWLAAAILGWESFAYGLLYISREISSTMILLHFGTYLQDYFSREQLKRVLPIVYGGGRAGGIFGAFLLENLSEAVGVVNMILVITVFCMTAIIVTQMISVRLAKAPDEDKPLNYGLPLNETPPEESAARSTMIGFLRYIWISRLLFWITCTSMVFVICRWLLNFQYNSFFESYFDEQDVFYALSEIFFEQGEDADVLDMAQFMGRYTQIALIVSLILQLFVVSRMISGLGILATHLIYSLLVVAALSVNIVGLTLTLAIFCRFVEAELRLGLRNPVMQLITNEFSKPVRARVRAWTVGLLVPVATLIAAGLLGLFVQLEWTGEIVWVGVGMGLIYLFCVYRMGVSFHARKNNQLADEKPGF